MYPIQIAQLAFGKMPKSITANGILNEHGCDVEMKVKLPYDDNKCAYLSASLLKDLDNVAKITGTKGEIIVCLPQKYFQSVKLIRNYLFVI